MKNNIIIHVPHSSTYLPRIFYKRIILDKKYIKKENIFMCDYKIDKFLSNRFNIIKFKYSRMFCDVERYKVDSEEEMSKYGMGVVYEKDSNNNKFINIDKKYKDKIIKKYYDKHHNKFNKLVNKILNKYNSCLIIDFHSYSDLFVEKVLNKTNNPDICIGITKEYYSKELTDFTINHFKKYGYSIKINYPYVGTMTPNNKDTRVKSIMIEINKRIYINNNKKLSICMNEYWKKLEIFCKILYIFI